MEKTLHITLKKKWFDMIAAGIKKEEYREIKPHWVKGLVSITVINDMPLLVHQVANGWYKLFKQFDKVSATNGYGKHRPNIKWKHGGIKIGTPNPEWCEPEDVGKTVFILSIGEILIGTDYTEQYNT